MDYIITIKSRAVMGSEGQFEFIAVILHDNCLSVTAQ